MRKCSMLAVIVMMSSARFAASQEVVGTWRGKAAGPGDFVEEVVIAQDGKKWTVKGTIFKDDVAVGKYADVNGLLRAGKGVQCQKLDKVPDGWDGAGFTIFMPGGDGLEVKRVIGKKFFSATLERKTLVAKKEDKTPKVNPKAPTPVGPAGAPIASFKTNNSLFGFTAFITPDGKQVGVVAPLKTADTIAIYDVESKDEVKKFKVPGPIMGMKLSSDGKTLAVHVSIGLFGGPKEGKQIFVYDLATGEPTQEINVAGRVVAMAYGGSGGVVAGGVSENFDSPKPITFWSTKTKEPICKLEAPAGTELRLDVSDDGATALIGAYPEKGEIGVVDIPSGKLRSKLQGVPHNVMRLSPSGRLAATMWYSEMTELKVWDTKNSTKPVAAGKFKGQISSMSFIDDERKMIVSGSWPDIFLFDLKSGATSTVATPAAKMNALISVPTPDGAWLLSYASDRIARVYSLRK